MKKLKIFYRGIDTLSYSATMPREIYNLVKEEKEDRQKRAFNFFHHDPKTGFTIRAGHLSDNPQKVREQGGYSAFVNVHSLACYNKDFTSIAQKFSLENCSINRIDFAVDMQNSVPDYKKIKVARQSAPMVVPQESITYGWGTKYKSISAIFYDKIKDIQASKGEKDYLLKHYANRDKRTGITRFEIRIMKEMIRRRKKIYSPISAEFQATELGELIKAGLKRVKMTDPKYPNFNEKIEKEIDQYFCIDIKQNIPRQRAEYDTTMLAKQMIGIAAAITKRSPRFREIAEQLESGEMLAELMKGIFNEYLNMPFGLTKAHETFVKIAQERDIIKSSPKTHV